MKIRSLIAATLSLILWTTSAAANVNIDSQTNAARAQYGLPPLTTSEAINSVAATRVQQITTNFAHPTSWQWLFDAIPGCESALGENIAYYTTGAEPAGWPVSAWMASPSHKANILNPGWNYQGSAMLLANGRTYAVQIFSKACAATQPAPPAPKPQPPIANEIPDTAMEPLN